MNIARRLSAAAVAAGLAFASPASAQVTFTGYTNGCFYTVVACTPALTPGNSTASLASLTYRNSTFSVTTANGIAQIGNAPNNPNVNNLGSFTLPNITANEVYAGDFFLLNIFFTAPSSAMPTNVNLLATLSGTLVNSTGGLTVDFNNAEQLFSWDGGTFSLEVADLNLTNTVNGTTVAVTGNLNAVESTVPEPGTYVLMASGLVGMAVMSRRRRALSRAR